MLLWFERDHYSKQLPGTDHTITKLNKYKKSVEDGVNYFTEATTEEEYFVKTKSYLVNYRMTLIITPNAPKDDSNYNIQEVRYI